ncbi:MAG: lysoplasmalogenase [Flavobacteriales bacterium]|nr:lysoplasmalogenase [Flavobacteriales bacterium]
MKRGFDIVFLLIVGLHIYAGQHDLKLAADFSKPFIVGSLLVYFLFRGWKYFDSSFFRLISIGLIFSLCGDVALIYQKSDPLFFTLGLSAFLIGHIFYTTAFTKTYLENHEIALIKRHGWVLILIAAYGFLFFRAIQDHLGKMIGPVMLYTLVISLMLLMAANRYKRVNAKSWRYIFFGALLFVASDSLLAWNKFVEAIDYSHFLIMGTYSFAQYFIAMGAVEQLRDQSQVHR